MRHLLTKRKKRLLREQVLQRIREKRRIARLDVIYNPNKVSTEHRPLVNRKYSPHEPTRGRAVLKFPKKMNFRGDIDETIYFLDKLKKEILYGDSTEVLLDQKALDSITPETAIILVSELQRCIQYKSMKKRLRGTHPDSPAVARILTDIGFYSCLNIKSPPHAEEKSSRAFFRIMPGNRTDARIANRLVSHFEKVVSFEPIARKRLLAALIECMDNVHNHAYRKDGISPDLIGEWWMAGFVDESVGQVGFIFYDQGVGVPTTLKEKWAVKIKTLVGMNDAELLQHAVLEGITRRKSERHGNGFPSFKEFINEIPAGTGGFLRVISNKGDYSYCRNARSNPTTVEIPLNGTLLIWSIHPNKETVDKDGRIDLSSEGLQTRLAI
ncbi:hypothetical protein FHP88_15615 [Sedimenticola selenatireducens]|uniref:ATP-binding protein n=1 Tax=Sedimenticola selenatireducens TaxID=191960 RepID=A0A557S0B9_9GAMM|nr:hypothetical protein [Sedimenticola selenatireducens]TVO70880.1 hypothetical protein FHP88_15615 [Sedimenticola selenatireducens]